MTVCAGIGCPNAAGFFYMQAPASYLARGSKPGSKNTAVVEVVRMVTVVSLVRLVKLGLLAFAKGLTP